MFGESGEAAGPGSQREVGRRECAETSVCVPLTEKDVYFPRSWLCCAVYRVVLRVSFDRSQGGCLSAVLEAIDWCTWFKKKSCVGSLEYV